MLDSTHRALERLRLRLGAQLSFNQKRVCLGVCLLITTLCFASWELDWTPLQPINSKRIFIGSVLLLVLFQHFVGPTFGEVQEYHDRKLRG
jgi:hypothetical protein